MIQVQCVICDRLSEVPDTKVNGVLCQVCIGKGQLGFMKVVEELK